MNTKHTQGQWTVNEKYEVEARNKMGKLIARFSQFTPSGFNGKEEANAKLISAAPDLLHALQMLVNDLERNDGDAINRATLIDEAKQAIHKATTQLI